MLQYQNAKVQQEGVDCARSQSWDVQSPAVHCTAGLTVSGQFTWVSGARALVIAQALQRQCS